MNRLAWLGLGFSLAALGCTKDWQRAQDAASRSMQCPKDSVYVEEGDDHWFAEGCGKRVMCSSEGGTCRPYQTPAEQMAAARKIFATEEFEKVHERIREAPLTNKQARDFLRMFLSGASAEKPDGQNRITIPPALRTYAGLERELVVTGVGAHAEIWDAEAWNSYAESNEETYSEMEQEVIPGLF